MPGLDGGHGPQRGHDRIVGLAAFPGTWNVTRIER